MLSPELLTLYRSHADEDDSGFYSIHAVRDLFDHIDAQAERIAAMIAAGDRLADDYADHQPDCPYQYASVVADEDCTCGFLLAVAAWERAKAGEGPR